MADADHAPWTLIRMRLGEPACDKRTAPAQSSRQGLSSLLHSPDFEIVVFVIVARDERVFIAAFGMNVFRRHEERRLHEAAWRLILNRAIQFIDRLPGLQ